MATMKSAKKNIVASNATQFSNKGGGSSDSPSGQPVEDTVQLKARRISEIYASLVDSPKSAWNSKEVTGLGEHETSPKTQPRSQEEFYKRVSSFQPGLWSVRSISPLECAGWGWKLLEKDVLQCVTCQEVICALLPDMKDRVAYNKFLDILKDRLETDHKQACGWLYNPCPRVFVDPLCIDTAEEIRNMMNSAHTLAALNSALPYLNNKRFTATLGADDEVVNGLFSSNDATEDVKITSVLLVLSGWSKGHGAYLKCTVCRRQVGLWSNISIADELNKGETETRNKTSPSTYSKKRKLDNVEEPSEDNRRVTRQSPRKLNTADGNEAKRMRTRSWDNRKEEENDNSQSMEMDVDKRECLLITSPSTQVEKIEKHYFSPLDEHRYWCPWITKIDDNDEPTAANYGEEDDDYPRGFCKVTEQVRVMLQMSSDLKSSTKEKYKENVQGLRIIRNLLDEIAHN